MTKNKTSLQIVSGPLTNKCLIAAPDISDTRFAMSVIYICEHSDAGTTGLIVNKPSSIQFDEVLKQLGIPTSADKETYPKVLWGGPEEQIRGFILHSNDYIGFETDKITDEINLTATIDVLGEIANGKGPKERLLTLGHMHWDAGRIEVEIAANLWFVMDADKDFLFNCPASFKWKKALSMIGIDPLMLSLDQGSV